ncbi:hypothetical protein U1Q18_046744 [Sarracenia purpurea var. burkii]
MQFLQSRCLHQIFPWDFQIKCQSISTLISESNTKQSQLSDSGDDCAEVGGDEGHRGCTGHRLLRLKRRCLGFSPNPTIASEMAGLGP